MKKFEIVLRDETVNEIEKLITYYNLRNKLLNENADEVTIENFIRGSVVSQLKEINTILGDLKLNQDLGKGDGVIRNRFKAMLEDFNISQKELATITGIDTSTLSLILNNKQSMTLDQFLKIWTVFGNPLIRHVLYRE